MSIQRLLNSEGKIGSSYIPSSSSAATITVPINAVVNGTAAGGGVIGQLLQVQVLEANSVAIPTSGTEVLLTTLSLPPGVWLVSSNVHFTSNQALNYNAVEARLKTGVSTYSRVLWRPVLPFAFFGGSLPIHVFYVDDTVNVNLVVEATYAPLPNFNPAASGIIQAVRIA